MPLTRITLVALIFSIFQAQFIRPAPAVSDDPTQARIWAMERPARTARWERRRFTRPELTALAARPAVFRDVAAWTEDEVILRADSTAGSGTGVSGTGPRGANAQFVTPNYFATLGLRLVAGQGFLQVPSDAPDYSAVMAFAVAEQLYGNAAAAVGRRILVDEVPVHVVGVAPPRFQGAVRDMDEPALWMPLSARTDVMHASARWGESPSLAVFALLAPGASR